MRALILAGGKGTRLRPLTIHTPKPVVPFMNRPFLLYQIQLLEKAGIDDITLSLSYQPSKIEDVLGDGSAHGVTLRYITEPRPMGTGGAYKYAANGSTDPFVVLNGDILTDIDLGAMIDHHRKASAVATIALAPVADPSRYGLVETRDDASVVRFLEKPDVGTLDSIPTNLINAGIYILESSVLDLIPTDINYSFEYDVFPAILERSLVFSSFSLGEGYWRDIGTPESYLDAHLDALSGRFEARTVSDNQGSDVANAATVDRGSLIAEGCVIKPGAKITNSVLGPGVHVDEKAVIEDSVIWAHTRIYEHAILQRAILGKGCHIGRHVSVGAGSVLGDKSALTDHSRV